MGRLSDCPVLRGYSQHLKSPEIIDITFLPFFQNILHIYNFVKGKNALEVNWPLVKILSKKADLTKSEFKDLSKAKLPKKSIFRQNLVSSGLSSLTSL